MATKETRLATKYYAAVPARRAAGKIAGKISGPVA
jgi:hypothetical protein